MELARVLERFLRVLLVSGAVCTIVFAIALMFAIGGGRDHLAHRFGVAIAALFVLGAIDTQLSRLANRHRSLLGPDPPEYRRYVVGSALGLLGAAAVLFGIAWFLPATASRVTPGADMLILIFLGIFVLVFLALWVVTRPSSDDRAGGTNATFKLNTLPTSITSAIVGAIGKAGVHTRIVVNGKEYSSVDEMPADIRAIYEQAMGTVLSDSDRDGIPDVLQGRGNNKA